MRQGKKNKTVQLLNKKPLTLAYKKRHTSLVYNLNEDSLKCAYEVV